MAAVAGSSAGLCGWANANVHDSRVDLAFFDRCGGASADGAGDQMEDRADQAELVGEAEAADSAS